jgi:hypothetical protein
MCGGMNSELPHAARSATPSAASRVQLLEPAGLADVEVRACLVACLRGDLTRGSISAAGAWRLGF